ncbi:uncharacterized protein LOC125012438 [Mugil cephalus]|uniref:uncharacterized protein LOC125012438 n=1 Tax=Mugil cephalus TaxID=48193 RepID=UPI001FB7A974|nr:uncharacterized protein LOC125012438 [Mugil cephalus]
MICIYKQVVAVQIYNTQCFVIFIFLLLLSTSLKRPTMFHVLALVILVQWRPVFPAPVKPSCDIDDTVRLTKLLQHEATLLLNAYQKFHGPIEDSVPEDVPDSEVSGTSVTEKLLDVCNKHMLFSLHILQVEAYQKDLLADPKPLLDDLSPLKLRLTSNYLLSRVKVIIQHIEGEIPELTTPAPLQLSHNDDYTKKVYGWGVIVRVVEWLKQVSQVLEEAREVCD